MFHKDIGTWLGVTSMMTSKGNSGVFALSLNGQKIKEEVTHEDYCEETTRPTRKKNSRLPPFPILIDDNTMVLVKMSRMSFLYRKTQEGMQ